MIRRTKLPGQGTDAPKMIRTKYPEKKFMPGTWLPTGRHGVISLHLDGHRNKLQYLPCPRGGLRILLEEFDKGGRLPMTLKQIREAVWRGRTPGTTPRIDTHYRK